MGRRPIDRHATTTKTAFFYCVVVVETCNNLLFNRYAQGNVRCEWVGVVVKAAKQKGKMHAMV